MSNGHLVRQTEGIVQLTKVEYKLKQILTFYFTFIWILLLIFFAGFRLFKHSLALGEGVV